MKRIVTWACIALFTVFLAARAEAQRFGGPEFMKGKFVVGGNFGVGYYGNCFHLGVAPQFGYRLTRSLEVGARLGYDMYFYNDYYYNYYFSHYFSGAVYANLEIVNGIYLHVEDEEMCSLVNGAALNPSTPLWYNSIFVGGGYRQYFNGSNYVYYALLYNLSWGYSPNGGYTSPYASPFVVRVGYCYNFKHGKEKKQYGKY